MANANICFNKALEVTTGSSSSVTIERIRTSPRYREPALMMFQHFFDNEIAAKQLFKISSSEDHEVPPNSKFVIHAQAIVDMMECGLQFADKNVSVSDLDRLREELSHLKQQHASKGVRGKYLAKMELAVVSVVEDKLRKKSLNDRKSWHEQSLFCL